MARGARLKDRREECVVLRIEVLAEFVLLQGEEETQSARGKRQCHFRSRCVSQVIMAGV
jgi:hypothetical protein